MGGKANTGCCRRRATITSTLQLVHLLLIVLLASIRATASFSFSWPSGSSSTRHTLGFLQRGLLHHQRPFPKCPFQHHHSQPRRKHVIVSVAAQEPPMKAVPPQIADFNKAVVKTVKDSLFHVYGDRHFARFYALETIARVPYFAYTSVLHLYETMCLRRRADLMKIHFAETWNELHHLLIMEELGGNQKWSDRFVAQHIAFFYYWMAIVLYMTSPAIAYNLNEQVERHAYDTYDKFLATHGEELKKLPAPSIAKKYYQTGDLYMFDEFHTDRPHQRRRPVINTLYDVFENIRDDEREHYLTMEAMQHEDMVCSTNTYDIDPEHRAARAAWKVEVSEEEEQQQAE